VDLDGGVEPLKLALVGVEVVGGVITKIDGMSTVLGELVCSGSTDAQRTIRT
jgi:hypothetical protein